MENNVKIKILGSASGIPTEKRFNVSSLLQVEKDFYLLDAGEPCAASLVREKIPYHRVKSVFISHMDPDHSGGIFMLIQLMELTHRESPLYLFLPEEAIDEVKRYLKTVYLFKELLHFRLKILPIEKGIFYQDENLIASSLLNHHLKDRLQKRYPSLKLQSYSFSLKAKEKRIGYSGDISEVEELGNLLTSFPDLLITEMAHFKPEELFKFLSKKDVKRIILTHIHPDWENKEEKILNLAKKYLGNKVTIAYDGMKIEI